MEKQAAVAMSVAAGFAGGSRLRAGGDLVIEQIRTIDAPRVFHPGTDDTGGFLRTSGSRRRSTSVRAASRSSR
jgi:hypothetical protein